MSLLLSITTFILIGLGALCLFIAFNHNRRFAKTLEQWNAVPGGAVSAADRTRTENTARPTRLARQTS